MLRCESRLSIPASAYALVYFYNFSQQRWTATALTFLGAAADTVYVAAPFTGANLGDYAVETGSGGSTVYARIYTCALTPGANSVLHDQLFLDIIEDIFSP